jgi:hypothetical protein
VDRLTDNVYTLNLPGDCYLDYHPCVQAVALACPGVNYRRLWSLPVRQPWEEPTDRPAGSGWYARRIDPQAEVG